MDGVIEGEELKQSVGQDSDVAAQAPPDLPPKEQVSEVRADVTRVPRRRGLRRCDCRRRGAPRWCALRRNKMRSGLSALGVIIAVAAVIAMTEIGQGSKATLQKSIASMGANTLMIFSGSTSTGGVSLGTGTALTLTPDDADEIARQCPAVSDVAPIVRARAQIVYGNRNWVPDQISGTTPSFLAVRDWQNMALGEMFTDRDVRNGNKVCVIGDTVKRNLFPECLPHRQGNPHQQRLLPRRWRPEPQGSEHDGHGSGQHRVGPLDHHQVPRERHHPEQHEPERQCR